MKHKKFTIRGQFSFVFILTMIFVLLLYWLTNTLYLGRYYLWNKENAIYNAYLQFNSAADEGVLNTDEFDVTWQRICSKYNISVIILDADSRTIKCSSNNAKFLVQQLRDCFFNTESIEKNQNPRIVKEENNYTMHIVTDPHVGTDYVEMWGVLDNGNLFLIRSPIESIQESVRISHKFLWYSGILVIIAGSLILGVLARRISRPILRLANISEKMKHLDFDAKYDGSGAAEIEVLGKNINELSETLEKTISELKTANNKLLQDIEKKEKIDERRREFLSNVSHELKTPIALIQGYAEGLKEGINDDAESREFYCDVIMDEASKMNVMVKKLLTLNQLESGSDVVTMERFDLITLVKNYLQSADILIRQSGGEVRLRAEEKAYVWADEFKVEEVFMNYFTNALNHLSGDKIIEVKIMQQEETVRLSVFNTGEPIPEESRPHLWEKFYKVDKARTREYGGSGIGLSIVKAIMDSFHQGYGVINYDNGVEFWMELEKAKDGSQTPEKGV
ncbi:MAG: HAMP domain-containing protein [Lachnospiraceae bacterium]|nr:HAMP domain-containing protein [Lachnospiraceae bacterium]